jgi:hypothetical protein
MSRRIYFVIALFLVFTGCSAKVPESNLIIHEPSKVSVSPDSYAPDRFGLTESKRQQIAEDINNHYRKIFGITMQKSPSALQDVLKGRKYFKESMSKRNEMFRSLWQNAYQELSTKYNLTTFQLNEILNEGIDKDWIKLPKLPVVYK